MLTKREYQDIVTHVLEELRKSRPGTCSLGYWSEHGTINGSELLRYLKECHTIEIGTTEPKQNKTDEGEVQPEQKMSYSTYRKFLQWVNQEVVANLCRCDCDGANAITRMQEVKAVKYCVRVLINGLYQHCVEQVSLSKLCYEPSEETEEQCWQRMTGQQRVSQAASDVAYQIQRQKKKIDYLLKERMKKTEDNIRYLKERIAGIGCTEREEAEKLEERVRELERVVDKLIEQSTH